MMGILCMCGHPRYRHIMFVGNCKTCGIVGVRHTPHCYKFRDPVEWAAHKRKCEQRWHRLNRYRYTLGRVA
jgi:hypothetical protein